MYIYICILYIYICIIIIYIYTYLCTLHIYIYMENTSILMYISHSDGFFLWAHGQGRATCCQIRFRAMGRLAMVKIRPEKSGKSG
jgi:hypothetical protein